MRFHGGSIMLLISMFLISCDKKETLSEVVERGLNVSSQQTMFLAEELENQEKKLPRTYENNELNHGFQVFSLECYGICMKMIQQKN